jgi:hypothetical protein
MMLRCLQMSALALALASAAGCSHASKINAIVPGREGQMMSKAKENGQFVLYRAVGVDSGSPSVEIIWSVPVSQGDSMGFRYTSGKDQQWDQFAPAHLQAFAAGQARDLGPYTDREVRYLWAPANTDIGAYLKDVENQRTMETITLQ